MQILDDERCWKAFNSWYNDAGKLGQTKGWEEVERQISHAPKMTHIEQIAFFMLKKYETREGWQVDFQKQIGKYRVDFLVQGQFSSIKGNQKCLEMCQIVVECDGHDFHEKTKEQAIYDKKRDRDLQSLGFRVYRFTGSEIWRTDGICILKSLNAFLLEEDGGIV